MKPLNRYRIKCCIPDNEYINIIQGGITYKNKFFYETRTDSNIMIFEYVSAGKGYIVIDDKMYTVTANNLYIIPTNRTYEYFTDSENPYERYWFYGNGTMLDGFYKMFFKDEQLAIANADFLEDFLKIFNVIKLEEHTFDSFAEISESVFKLFIKAIQSIIKQKSLPTISHKNIASRIKSYLLSHFEDKFSLEELAEEFILSKNQIINVFKSTYNLTPQVFHMMYKLDFAEEMLKRNMTNKEIAERLSFYDERYFSKMFTKYKGYSPSSVLKSPH